MNGLLQTILELDAVVFTWINTGCSNPVFDTLAPWFRDRFFWAPLYLFIITFAWLNFGKKGWVIVLGIILLVGITDQFSSNLIKKNVKRLRPCNDPAMYDRIQLRVHCGSGYSFTSSHATNHFAVALFLIGVLGHIRRWIKPAALLWASSIALSQVYVGVHYPGDILCGALIGAFFGWALGKLANWERFKLGISL